MKIFIVKVVPFGLLFFLFLAHLFLRPAALARFIRLPRPSKLWLRLFGLCGLVWLALSLVTDPHLKLTHFATPPDIDLTRLKSYLIGLAIGLYLALLTERLDRQSKE